MVPLELPPVAPPPLEEPLPLEDPLPLDAAPAVLLVALTLLRHAAKRTKMAALLRMDFPSL